MIQFVYFDAGFTLLEPWPSVGWHYARLAHAHGVVAGAEALTAAFRPAWMRAVAEKARDRELPYGRNLEEAFIFWSAVVRACFEASEVEPPASPEFYREAFDTFSRGNAWRLYDDVAPALALLDEAEIPYGILSNWDPRLYSVLEDHGLGERMRAVVISSEAGAEKPRGEIFRRAEAAAGVTPGEVALVGDDPEADGAGATAAGWRACIVRRDGSPPDRDLPWAEDLVGAVRQLLNL